MKKRIPLLVSLFLTSLLASLGPLSAAQASDKTSDPGNDQTGLPSTPIAVRTLLEEAQKAGDLPEGMVIRLSACLGARADDADADDNAGDAVADAVDNAVSAERRELWEISRGRVHRVTFESEMGKSSYRRVESRALDTRGISRTLLDGKALEIHARKGEGPEVAFVGTRYQLGSRSIEVVWKGETVLNLLEARAAFLMLYRESDARAFGALYEKLASPIRAKFKP